MPGKYTQQTLGLEAIDAGERETRANLSAVVRRVIRMTGRKAGGSDFMLHEFLMWLNAVDVRGDGVTRTHEEMADYFLTSRRSMQRLPSRAEDLDLVTITESFATS